MATLSTISEPQQQIVEVVRLLGKATPAEVISETGLNPGSVRAAMRRLEAAGLLARPGYGQYSIPDTPLDTSAIPEESHSSDVQEDDLVETGRMTYLQLVGPGGRVMLQVEMVIKATTKPHQIALDVKEGIG